jgi:predicted nucleotidyltransferase
MGTIRGALPPFESLGVGIADALFSRVQQRVLGILFGNPARSFYAKELIRVVGSGTGAVQRELGRLEASGLVTVTRIGNQKHYRANAASPVFEELSGLVRKTSGMADVIRSSLSPLASRIECAFVFGSMAKGEATTGSDVDLMVISEDLTHADLYGGALAEAEQRLGRRVNPTVLTRSTLAKRREQGNAFVQRVLEQPKVWVIGGEDDLRP